MKKNKKRLQQELLLSDEFGYGQNKFYQICENISNNLEAKAYWHFMDEKLFYNEKTLKQVSELALMLQKKNFDKIVTRAYTKRPNLPFIVLLHGPSGTGKTALVREICRRTKRHMLEIKTEMLRNEGLGNDEKVIKQIFDDYICASGFSQEYPILFFDECEAHLCGRMKVDSFNPTMINHVNNITTLWLKQLQDFHGILFLATNRKEDFDEAFARRILFQIEIDHPTKEIQAAIWSYYFPKILTPEQCKNLAEKTNFTGGQIKQVQTKTDFHEMLYGKLDYDIIHDACETNGKMIQERRRRIGY